MTVPKELNSYCLREGSSDPFLLSVAYNILSVPKDIFMRLHEPNSLSETPCIGSCTTTVIPFDKICQGCGRSVEQIRDWCQYTDTQKKLINIQNWLKFDIKQKRRYREMTMENKLEDMRGRLLTTRCLIEMISEDLTNLYGKDPAIKESYDALYQAYQLVVKAKEKLPIARQEAV